MEFDPMTDNQYQDVIAKTATTTLYDLYFEIKDETDPEVIIAKVLEKAKEVSPTANPN